MRGLYLIWIVQGCPLLLFKRNCTFFLWGQNSVWCAKFNSGWLELQRSPSLSDIGMKWRGLEGTWRTPKENIHLGHSPPCCRLRSGIEIPAAAPPGWRLWQTESFKVSTMKSLCLSLHYPFCCLCNFFFCVWNCSWSFVVKSCVVYWQLNKFEVLTSIISKLLVIKEKFFYLDKVGTWIFYLASWDCW